MQSSETIIRQIYDSDVILSDSELSELVNDSIFDLMEDFLNRMIHGHLTITEEEFLDFEKKFTTFYYEYAYIQFKRGLELGLCMRSV